MTNQFTNPMSVEELNLLIERYPISTNDELKILFPNKSISCLYRTISRLPQGNEIKRVRAINLVKREKQNLIDEIIIYYEEKGFPTSRNFRSKENFIKKHFGNFESLLNQCGLSIPEERKRFFNREEYSEDYLLDVLRVYVNAFIEKNNKIPTYSDYKKADIPHPSTYLRKFNMTLEEILEVRLKINKKYVYKQKIKKQLIDLSIELGKTPSKTDLENYCKVGKVASPSAYSKNFGSLLNAYLECDFKVRAGYIKSKTELLQDLKKLYKKTKRPIIRNDILNLKDFASPAHYADVFGSWTNALELAGIPIYDKIYFSNNGTKCFSWYECQFINMLEEKEIEYLYETPYKSIVKTRRMYKYDFVISFNDDIYFVEIFGITNNKEYDKRKSAKIEINSTNRIPCVYFEDGDLRKFYNLDLLYGLLMNKITKCNTLYSTYIDFNSLKTPC